MQLDLEYFDPLKLLKITEKSLDYIPNAELFNKSKYQKLTEGWCAAMFGIGYSKFIHTCTIAVNESDTNLDADFYLKTENNEWPFQLAEVMEPGRKRGKEYKENPRTPVAYRPAYAKKHAADWVYKGIKKKVEKRYADGKNLNLVVYVNFSTAKFEYQVIATRAIEFTNDFNSVWLVTNTHMCSLFSAPGLGKMLGWGEVRSIEDYYL